LESNSSFSLEFPEEVVSSFFLVGNSLAQLTVFIFFVFQIPQQFIKSTCELPTFFGRNNYFSGNPIFLAISKA